MRTAIHRSRHVARAPGLLAGASLAAMLATGVAEARQTTPDAPASRAASSGPTAAPSAPETAQAVGEIIVTAQFRSQRLQDTPLAISAVNAEMLAARGQTNLADLGSAAPNLTIKQTGDAFGPAAAMFIRGVGQYDSNLALEPGVGVYVDDVYYSTVFGTTFDLVDLDRVEVLRGPQGTLAGKNSIGGAVKLYSRQPDNAFAGFAEATVGRFNRIDLRAGVNIPLIADKLAIRLSGVRNDSDGYVTRYDYGCLHPSSGVPSTGASGDCKLGTSGGRKSWGLRGVLGWTPNDDFKLTVTGDYSQDHSTPPASVTTYVEGRGRTFLNGATFDNRFVTAGTYRSYATYRDPGGIYPGVNPVTGAPTATVSQPSGFEVDPDTRLKDWGVSARAVWDLAPGVALTSISGYRGYSGLFATDADGTPFNYQLTQQALRHRQYSQELRLSGRIGSRLDATVGGLYFEEHNRQGGRNQIPGTFDTEVNDRIESRSYSGFAHATLRVTDAFDLTGGLRYSNDRKAYGFNRSAAIQASIDGRTAVYAGDRFDYKLNASYRLAPDILAYAQYSTGYRAGGTNPRPFAANQVVAFDPETLEAYEIGLKTAWLERKVTLNLAAFVNDYKDILVTSLAAYTNPNMPINEDPSSPNYNPAAGVYPAFVILNGGAARLKGAELEVFVHPRRGLRIDGSLSYLDFGYTRLSAAAVAAGLTKDSPLAFAPRWKASFGVENAFDLGPRGTLTPRLDFSYQSHLYAQPTASALSRVAGYGLIDARLTYAPVSEAWKVSLAVRNLANKYYYLTRFDTADQSGTATAQPGRPREWTLTVRRNF